MAATTQELYGLDVDPTEWRIMPYEEVLQLKRKLSGNRIKALDKANYLWRDYANINACKSADKYNDERLEEIGSYYNPFQ